VQQRATHREEITVGQKAAGAEPATVAARPVAAAEVLHAMAAAGIEHELEVPARDSPVGDPDGAVRRAPELEDAEVRRWLGRFIGRLHAIGAVAPFKHRVTLDVATYGEASSEFLLARRLPLWGSIVAL